MAIPEPIQTFLNRLGFDYTPLAHPLAFTAPEEAAVAHVPGRQWAKTVVYMAGHEPVLAVLPAMEVVDAAKLEAMVGHPVRLANEDEMAPLYPESEVGAMPPLGPLYGQRVFVDQALTLNPEIVFNAGTHRDAVRMRYRDFGELVHPVVGRFGRPVAPSKRH